MEFSSELAAGIGVISSIFAAGVTWGVMSTRLDRVAIDVADEVEKREKLESRFVTMEHFKAVVQPMQEQLRDLGRDIKRILAIVSHHRDEEES